MAATTKRVTCLNHKKIAVLIRFDDFDAPQHVTDSLRDAVIEYYYYFKEFPKVGTTIWCVEATSAFTVTKSVFFPKADKEVPSIATTFKFG